ncbi:MAG TPA: phytoene desaturase family protein [Pyrinomonadaceae bacterium]
MKPLRANKGRRAVVVGGGLGGLATAVRLAAVGWDVEVCESGPRLGGKMNSFERGGFRFDTGPSLITMPWVFEELFAAAGSSLAEHVKLAPVSPLADYVFDDGTRLRYTSRLPEWLAEVRRVEPRDCDGFMRFMRLGARLFALSRETFLRRPPLAPPDLRSLKALRHLPLGRAWGNYHSTVAAHFRSPHLRQMFDRYPTYVGSSPYSSPATLAVIPYIEFAHGGWHVEGGLYRVVESIAALARGLGVRLHTGARVEAIERGGRRVRGVRLADGTRLAADVVVMNGDAATTEALLGGGRRNGHGGQDGAAARRLKERSLSGFVLLLGLKRRLPDLAHHSVYFSKDYRAEFSQLFDGRRFPDDPTVYVCAPSRTDPGLAPEGGETLFVMANAPATDTVWDGRQVETARARVFERLSRGGFPDVAADVVVSDVWTPGRFADAYLCPGGSIYGSHSHGWRSAFLRPPNRHPCVGGLYHVGGSSHPGGGTPTVLLSAQITSELIGRHEA